CRRPHPQTRRPADHHACRQHSHGRILDRDRFAEPCRLPAPGSYAGLVRNFWEESARQYGQANEWAIGYIAGLVDRQKIACSFERMPAHVYAGSQEAIEDVKNEASVATRLGLPAHLSTDIPAPVPAALALRFDEQAQFNPVRYLAGLAGV